MKEYRRIGELLIDKRMLTQSQLDEALRERRGRHERLGDVLISMGFVREKDITDCLSDQFGFDVVDPLKTEPEREALAVLDQKSALARRVLPLTTGPDFFECIIADPIDIDTTDMLTRLVQKQMIFRLAPTSALIFAIRRAYDPSCTWQPRQQTTVAPKRIPRPQNDRKALISMLEHMF